ncbi:MAG: Dam family site-specific DNA-(adenine-N6)-methyltransferase [Planctomycetia bacterium]|nr:Dam family site-specific DNA-(adenine-N6)-methyltransferase [Planctomycetia bacterium]
MNNSQQKPFLRWAGGKTWLLKNISSFLPDSFNNYHEPFLGGGSVFFYLKPPNNSFLSDSNIELINAFQQIRDNVDTVISFLSTYTNTKTIYYRIRNSLSKNNVERAAQFIYLNRTSFNGIYRVNLKGEYNVPYGYNNYKILYDFDLLRSTSNALSSASLKICDFYKSIQRIKKDDLVFLDPPYTASHIKNGFIKYNEKLFSWQDQERLALYIEEIKKIGAFYLMTNAKHESVEDLYSKYDMPIVLNRFSTIGGKNAKRSSINELLFTNVK